MARAIRDDSQRQTKSGSCRVHGGQWDRVEAVAASIHPGAFVLILHSRDGETDLADTTISALRKAYPFKDVDTELAKMHLWLLGNVSRRPANLLRFVRNWMDKAPRIASTIPTHASQVAFVPDTRPLLPMPDDVRKDLAKFVDKITVKPWRH